MEGPKVLKMEENVPLLPSNSPFFGSTQDGSKTKESILKQSSEGMEEVALAFPGGGIRNAAFGYGVLRYLVENESKYKIKALTGVSGGGFTASSFVQNVYCYMKEGLSYSEASKKFFESRKMAKNSGYLSNFSGSIWNGIGELLSLFAIIITWLLLLILEKVRVWFFVAILVDDLFGEILKKDDWEQMFPLFYSLGISLISIWAAYVFLKTFPASSFALRLQNLNRLAFNFIVFLGFLFFFVKAQSMGSRENTGLILIVIVVALALKPFFNRFTPMRNFFSIIIFAAIVSRISWWKVYQAKDPFFFGEYTNSRWNTLFMICGVLALFPFDHFQKVFFHYYYVWRLQKSFYLESGFNGCSGAIPIFNPKCGGNPTRLGDIIYPEIPEYIALTSLNGWKRNPLSPRAHHILTFSTGTSAKMRIVAEDVNEIELDASYIKISEAASLSGAAIAYRMGRLDNRSIRFFQVECGLGLGNWILTKKEGLLSGIGKWLLIFAFHAPWFILSLLIVSFDISPRFLLIPVVLCVFLLSISVIFPPDSIFWVFYFPWIVNFYETFDLVVYGGNPLPLRVYVSDGAHDENMALIPLLERRQFKTIILCDGSEDPQEDCGNLLEVIRIARERLHCSFSPFEEGIDIETAIAFFAKSSDSSFSFRVRYFGEQYPEKRMESKIVYLKPRRNFALGRPSLNISIQGCCCDFCHSFNLSFLGGICGQFPQHSIMNQFFTPTLFENYQELGYQTAQVYFQEKDENLQVK